MVGVMSSLSCSNASPSPRSSSTVLSRSLAGVAHLLSSRSEERASSLAVWYEVAREEGYVFSGGRSSVAWDGLVRGGLGSGVGGLRALTGVLRDDFWEMSEFRTLSAWGGCSGPGDLPSCETVGGVGGRPLSGPFNAPGDSSRVLSWLQAVEPRSSVVCEAYESLRSSEGGAVAEERHGSLRRGRCLDWRRLGAAWNDDSSRA